MLDRGGNPVAGVTVSFFLLSGGNGRGVATETDRDGRFRVALVPGAKYQLLSTHRLLRNPGDVEVGSAQTKDLGDLPLAD